LPMDFAFDDKTLEIKDEYMFGDNLLVAPVTDYMYHTPPQITTLVPKEVFKNGVNVKYFKDKDFKTLSKETKEENVDIYWYTGRPEYVTDSMYSVKWEGVITAPETGKYQFQIKSFDTRVIVFNGDTLKVLLDGNEPYFEFVNMEKGKEYPIVCQTQNNQTGAARFRLYWKTPSDFEKESQKAEKPKVRQVYLPKGCNWVDFWSSKTYNGGQTISVEAPIDIIPLFVKEGSILPLGPNVQYAMENPFGEIQIRVYTGKDCDYTLYEDCGDNLDYQNDKYSAIKFSYSEKDRVLTISDIQGGFPQMPKERIFNVTVNGKTIEKVKYSGQEIKVKL